MRKFKINVMAIAALVIATSTLAFKASEAKKTNLVWFEITQNHAPGEAVPSADAIYITTSPNPPSVMNCGLEVDAQCVSGFSTEDVNSSNELKDDSQEPENFTITRSEL